MFSIILTTCASDSCPGFVSGKKLNFSRILKQLNVLDIMGHNKTENNERNWLCKLKEFKKILDSWRNRK